jgi:hypothetical protein
MSLTSIFPSKFMFSRKPEKPAVEKNTVEKPAVDLRTAMFAPEPQARVDTPPKGDIAARLRALDGSAPVAKNTILEAAAEIERLRGAIRAHREQVWGADAPDHMSDAALYQAIDDR